MENHHPDKRLSNW